MSDINLQLIKVLQDNLANALPGDWKPPLPGREVCDGQGLRKALEEAGYQLDPPYDDQDDGEE